MSFPLNAANRNILLVLVAENPQIVTESIYAYWRHKDIGIDEIILIATAPYAKEAVKVLTTRVNGENSILEALQADCGIPAISFSSDSVHVPLDEHDEQIEDVQTPSQMIAFADYILNLVFKLTNNESINLHASLAGGRKTMTFYLSYAMSIYGRAGDTLSHVFVDQEFLSNNFFYPTKASSFIKHRGKSLDISKAEVTLSEIPYIQLRPNLPKKFLERKITFKEGEMIYKLLNAPLSLEVKVQTRTLICSGVKIVLSPANFAFYLMMLDDLMNAHEGFDCPVDECPDLAMGLIYLNKRLEMMELKNDFGNIEEAIKFAEEFALGFKQSEINGLRNGLKKSFFNARKNEISKILRAELPEIVAEHYDIDSVEKVRRDGATKPVNFFGLNLAQEAVFIN